MEFMPICDIRPRASYSLINELINTPTKATSDIYKSFHDKIQEWLLSIKNIDIDTSSWDPLLFQCLEQTTRSFTNSAKEFLIDGSIG